MKLKRNVYIALGAAAWKYGMPYARKRIQQRKADRRQAAATA